MAGFFRRIIEGIGDFVWDVRNGRYTRRDGTPVNPLEALALRQTDLAGFIAQAVAQLMRTGDVNAWRDAFALELRRSIIETYVLGRGGWTQLTTADRQFMRQLVESEMTYLRQFALDIQTFGLSEAQIRARMELYANHLHRNYAAGKRTAFEQLGYNEERRVLSPVENCDDCIGYAGEGWQTIGYFPLPGELSQCGANCQCEFEFR